MPAPSYHPRIQSIPPPAPPRASSNLGNGRYPLADAINNNQYPQPHQAVQDTHTNKRHDDQPPAVPEKQQERERGKNDPPLPRQNAKVQPPTPPPVIRDKSRALNYERVGFLGQGGFARVYEVQDVRASRFACKVVTKDSLKTKKAKTKLYAEIKIHRSLEHPNIVKFHDVFEDESNVYMTLGLCTMGSLADMLRPRRKFSEPEARFFMIQLIGACHYMHEHQVIHRDLKLGNLFLDSNMNIKVGDFGLAALIESPGERKKTICGTPNYIAPEVLFDVANGHSFEVDTWSIGVILYTLVVGKPPFQTHGIDSIYERIRNNEYEFPSHSTASNEVRILVQAILTRDPSDRPPLLDIIEDAWFVNGLMPPSIPPSAREIKPDFTHVTRRESKVNLARVRRAAGLDVEAQIQQQEFEMGLSMNMGLGRAPSSSAGSGLGYQSQRSSQSQQQQQQQTQQPMSSSLAQQEKEFQKAVQPGSPISALLSSARTPLLVAPPNSQPPMREASLFRKLQMAKKEQARASPARTAPAAVGGGMDAPGRLNGIGEEGEDDYELVDEKATRRGAKELESQKARIVAQMAPPSVPGTGPSSATGSVNGDRDGDWDEREAGQRENRPPSRKEREREREARMKERELEKVRERELELERLRERELEKQRERELEKQRERDLERQREREAERQREREVAAGLKRKGKEREALPQPPAPSSTSTSATPKPNTFDATSQIITAALEAQARGKLFRDPREDAELPDERVFITAWVDYCNKYGMGYALTDGTVAVHYNDSTSIVLAPDKHHFDYISARRNGSVFVRKNYTVSEYPEDLSPKVYLLKHFERYIMENLFRDYGYAFQDLERTKGMHFVQKYLRMKNVIIFKMSHDSLQFNFYDHSKIILSSYGHKVIHIDKENVLTRWSLSEIMTKSLLPPVSDPAEAKLHQRLMDKIKYCKEILMSIKNASISKAEKEKGPEGLDADGGLGTGDLTIRARSSKMSLR